MTETGMRDEVRRVAGMLCNCAQSRGRHSIYCPALTAVPKLNRALTSHRARMMNSAAAEDAAYQRGRESQVPLAEPDNHHNAAACPYCTPGLNHEKRGAVDDEDFGPGLVIEAGDCEFGGLCGGCQKPLGTIRPDQSLDVLGRAWDMHVNRDGCPG